MNLEDLRGWGWHSLVEAFSSSRGTREATQLYFIPDQPLPKLPRRTKKRGGGANSVWVEMAITPLDKLAQK